MVKNIIIAVLASLLILTVGFFLEITEGYLSGLMLSAIHKSALIGSLFFDERLRLEFGGVALLILIFGVIVGRNQRG